MVTEGTETALVFAKNIGVRLHGEIFAHGLTFPGRRAHTRLEPHHDEYDAQCLRSRRVLAQVPCRKAQLDEVIS